MISKQECMNLLLNLEDSGISIDSYMRKLIIAPEPPLEVLRFIAKNKGIEVLNFFDNLRQKHNKNKSPLYLNLIKGPEENKEILITLASLLTQIMIFSEKVQDKETFIKEARAEEISRVLNEYTKTFNIDQCIELLKLIKTDIMVLEFLDDRREIAQ